MHVTFLGAAGTVTGSRFLVRAGRTRVLIDCGLFQGFKEARKRNWNPLDFDPAEIDAVILTHAHIDHSGYLPILVREGFSGPIHCTPPTRALLDIMLSDSGRLHEEDARYANKKRFTRHRPALPLYTEKDARRVMPLLKPMRFGENAAVGEVAFHYAEAGHILGAASVHLSKGKRSILFSGDIGRAKDPLMRPPTPPQPADVIVMESTYGDRRHKSVDVIEALGKVAERTLGRDGVLLVPSFAVGRAQTILYCLEQCFRNGTLARVPVYLDSPMATEVTTLYRRFADYHKLTEEQCELFAEVTYVRETEASKALNFRKGPMVIVSASGMLTGGRVLHHLKERLGDRRNTVLLPGFQAPGTRGASLVGGASEIKVHGMYFDVEADVVQLDAFSAHADQAELLAWLGSTDHGAGKVFLVHGEASAADELRRRCTERFDVDVRIPQHREIVDLS